MTDCGLTPSTGTQFSEQEYEYSYLTASNRHPSTLYSTTSPQAFHGEPGHILSRGRQNVCINVCLWHVPRIS